MTGWDFPGRFAKVMRAVRIVAAFLAFSGVGGFNAAAHTLGGDHAHAHDAVAPHSHEHDADHHEHDVDSDGRSEARLLPSTAALPSAPNAAFSPLGLPIDRQAEETSLFLARRSGAPPGRRVPPLPARAPPA